MYKGYHKTLNKNPDDDLNAYTNDDFKKIEKSIGRRLSDEHRKALNHAKLIWETSKALLPVRIPMEKELQDIHRKKIDDIKIRIAELIELLESDGYLIESRHYGLDRLMDELNLTLRFVESAQKEKGKPLKRKISAQKGRTPEHYRATFILDLAEIFEKITGDKAASPAYNDYTGTYECKNPFLDFSISCVRPIETTQLNTLASAIKKILAENKKKPLISVSVTTKSGKPNKNQIFSK